METGRVFEDVIADSSAQVGVLGTGKDTEKSSNLCSFTDQMLAQLAVLRNLLVNEVYLLPKRKWRDSASLSSFSAHLTLEPGSAWSISSWTRGAHFAGSRVDPAQKSELSAHQISHFRSCGVPA